MVTTSRPNVPPTGSAIGRSRDRNTAVRRLADRPLPRVFAHEPTRLAREQQPSSLLEAHKEPAAAGFDPIEAVDAVSAQDGGDHVLPGLSPPSE